MIRITDTTLSCLDRYQPEPAALQKLLSLLCQLPIDAVEMSVSVYEKLLVAGGLPLQKDETRQIQYILHTTEGDLAKYSLFPGSFLIEEECGEKFKDIADIKEQIYVSLPGFGDFSEPQLPDKRLTGFGELMRGDYALAFSSLLTQAETIEFCPSDEAFCAVALAVEWCRCGGRYVTASFAGIGGQVQLEALLVALYLEELRPFGGRLDVLPQLKLCLEEIIGESLPHKQAVIGEEIFFVEAGIHVDGLAKNPLLYEPYPPEFVGRKRRIIMGKHSGKNAVIAKLKELNLKMPNLNMTALVQKLQQSSMQKQTSLTDAEFIELVTRSRLVHQS